MRRAGPDRTDHASRTGAWRAGGAILAASALLGAAAAYTYTRYRRIETQDHPPPGEFISANGVDLHYFEAGDPSAPALVILPGNGASVEDIQASRLLEALSRRFRCIVIDRPGHGHSHRRRIGAWTPWGQAETIVAAIDALGLRKPILMGHSWGALVGASIGLDYPDAVSGLVLMSGYYYSEPRADIAVLGLPSIPLLGDIYRYTAGPLVVHEIAPRLIARMFAPREVPERFWREFPVSFGERPWQIRASAEESASMAAACAAIQSRYRDLDVPLTVIAGDSDRIVDPGLHSLRLARDVEGADMRLLKGLGHMIHYFAQDEIVGVVMDLAERIGVQGGDPDVAVRAVPRSVQHAHGLHDG